MDEERHADPDGNPDSHAYGNPDGHADPDGHAYGNPDGHAYGDADRISDAYADSDAHPGSLSS